MDCNFTGAQSGLSIDGDGAALEGAFIAIALFALVMQIARCFPVYFARVSKCIQRDYYLYCSVCRAVRIHLRGCGSGGNRRNGNVICRCFNSLLYKEPFMAQISDTVSHTFTGCQRCPGSRFGGFRLCFVFAGLTVGALFAFYHLNRMRTPVSGILLPLTGFCCMFTASTQFRFAASIAMLVFVALEVSAALTEKREAPSTAELIIASLMFQVASAIALIASGRVSDSSYSVIYMLPVLISAAILLVLRLAGVKFAEAVRLRVVTAVMLFQSLVPGIVIFFITDGADAVIIVLNSFLILLAAALSMRLRSDGEHVSVAFILALTGALNSIALSLIALTGYQE